jgi:hypothetical protein
VLVRGPLDNGVQGTSYVYVSLCVSVSIVKFALIRKGCSKLRFVGSTGQTNRYVGGLRPDSRCNFCTEIRDFTAVGIGFADHADIHGHA